MSLLLISTLLLWTDDYLWNKTDNVLQNHRGQILTVVIDELMERHQQIKLLLWEVRWLLSKLEVITNLLVFRFMLILRILSFYRLKHRSWLLSCIYLTLSTLSKTLHKVQPHKIHKSLILENIHLIGFDKLQNSD